MTTGNKIIWKRGEIAPKEQFLLFSTLFYIYISNVKLHIHLLKKKKKKKKFWTTGPRRLFSVSLSLFHSQIFLGSLL